MRDLQLEINANFTRSHDTFQVGGAALMITPPLDEDYWLFRVKLYEDQAILGFPKFGTIGIGFAQEEDWNTNLPYTCPPEQIYSHIEHNKQYEQITAEECLAAIRLIQEAATSAMDFDTLRTLPGIPQEEMDKISEDILAMATKRYTWEEKIDNLAKLAKAAGRYLNSRDEQGTDYNEESIYNLREAYEEFCQWRHDEPYVVDEIKALLLPVERK